MTLAEKIAAYQEKSNEIVKDNPEIKQIQWYIENADYDEMLLVAEQYNKSTFRLDSISSMGLNVGGGSRYNCLVTIISEPVVVETKTIVTKKKA